MVHKVIIVSVRVLYIDFWVLAVVYSGLKVFRWVVVHKVIIVSVRFLHLRLRIRLHIRICLRIRLHGTGQDAEQ